MSVGVFAESATEWSCRINISCTAGPNMYSPSVLVFISTICAPLSPSSFPLQGSPKLDPAHGFQRMSVPVWSAALLFGELPPGEGVGRKKKTGFGSKKKQKKNNSLFGEERKQQPLVANRCTLFPPCHDRLLSFQLKKSWKSMSERVTLRVV